MKKMSTHTGDEKSKRAEQTHQEYVPLVLNLSVKGTQAKTTVVEVGTGTTIRSSDFHVGSHLFALLGSKKRAFENLLKYERMEEMLRLIRDIGELVYTSVVEHLKLEHLFEEGGYRVSVHAEGQARALPIELTHYDRFIFERNLLSLRGRNDPPSNTLAIGRILIIADPLACYQWALREGMLLYDFFRSMGLSVKLISRPLQREKFLELFTAADIVHFCGHIATNESRTGWDIGTGVFSGSDLGLPKKPPALVFSSGCGNTLPLGFTFLTLGVRNCIGTRWQIPDTDLRSFILAFYESLFRVGDIGLAFHRSLKGRYDRGDTMPLVFTLQGASGTRYEKSDT
jgi:hypothetical protein